MTREEMNIYQKVERANYLKEQLREIKYFRHTLSATAVGSRYQSRSFIKVRTTNEYSILGCKPFWGGVNETELKVPLSLIDSLSEVFAKEEVKIEEELKTIINN